MPRTAARAVVCSHARGARARRGADARNRPVAARAQDGCTPLYWAAQNGDVDIARLLLERGADVNAKENVRRAAPRHRRVAHRAASAAGLSPPRARARARGDALWREHHGRRHERRPPAPAPAGPHAVYCGAGRVQLSPPARGAASRRVAPPPLGRPCACRRACPPAQWALRPS
jgi:hypothetical protein